MARKSSQMRIDALRAALKMPTFASSSCDPSKASVATSSSSSTRIGARGPVPRRTAGKLAALDAAVDAPLRDAEPLGHLVHCKQSCDFLHWLQYGSRDSRVY